LTRTPFGEVVFCI